MRRKFSFDLPILKHVSSRTDQLRTTKERPVSSPPDSPYVVPQSIRPPLPNDVDHELRSACAYVFYNHRPSHIKFDARPTTARPHNAYSTIQAGLDAYSNSTTTSTDVPGTSKYSYKPDVATEDLFKEEGPHEGDPEAILMKAANRFENPKLTAATTRMRKGSLPQIHATAAQIPTTLSTHDEVVTRPKLATRAESIDTVESAQNTDSTEEAWSNSTRITTAGGTPAIPSNRASSHHTNSQEHPRKAISDVEGVKAEVEKESKLVEEENGSHQVEQSPTASVHTHEPAEVEKAASSERKASVVSVRSHHDDSVSAVRRRASQTHARKLSSAMGNHHASSPAPPTRPAPLRPASRQSHRHEDRVDDEDAKSMDRRASQVSQGSTGADETYYPLSRNVSVTAPAASGRRRFRHETPRQSEVPMTEPAPRSSSKTRSFFSSAKEYIRPSSSNSRRKDSVDIRSNSDWAQSTEDLSQAGTRESAASNHLRRPSRDERPSSPQPQHKASNLNLNRQLPPLPGLDQWTFEEARHGANGKAYKPQNLTAPAKVVDHEYIAPHSTGRVSRSAHSQQPFPSSDRRGSNTSKPGSSHLPSSNPPESSAGIYYEPRSTPPDSAKSTRTRHIFEMQKHKTDPVTSYSSQNKILPYQVPRSTTTSSADDKPKRRWWKSKDKSTQQAQLL